jgi:hypothetical protein
MAPQNAVRAAPDSPGNEVLATARAIERTLKTQKLDCHDVAAAVPALAPPPPGTREAADDAAPLWSYLDFEERLQWLEAIVSEPALNHWSRSFANSVAEQIRSGRRLSPKQLACIDKILADGWQRGVCPDGWGRA